MKDIQKKSHHIWRPFEEARTFVHSLNLQSSTEWYSWVKSDNRPDDIPSNPANSYKDKGWAGMGDWLGTGRNSNKNKVFRPFKEARAYVRSIGLKGQKDWIVWANSSARPMDIPSKPATIYKNKGWVGIGDWLGTGRIAPKDMVFRPFEEARAFVHSLNLQSSTEWHSWAKSDNRPDDIPSTPDWVYKEKGWAGVGDWLGTGRIAHQNKVFRPFKEARAYVRSIGLKGQKDWIVWTKSDAHPNDIPTCPDRVYKDEGWVGWGDWLGTGRIAHQNKVFCPFEEARAFVHSLNLQTSTEWHSWAKSDKRPDDIPSTPEKVFKDKGWVSMGDWLGTGSIAPKDMVFRPFQEARAFVHSLNLQSSTEWYRWAKSDKRPDDIPSSPEWVYKDKGWTGMGDWLGTGRIAPQDLVFRPFEEARAFVHSLNLQSSTEWYRWAKSDNRPDDIPNGPARVYKGKGWVSMGDWLGTGRIRPQDMVFRPFEEARAFVQGLGLKGSNEWRDWAKSDARPKDIPVNSASVYKNKGWVSMGDWLGTGRIAPKDMVFRPFEEARAFVQGLGLKGSNEWRDWAKSDARPKDIPTNPAREYKDKGWIGMSDWLGKGRRRGNYPPFIQSRTFVHSLGLKNLAEWRTWAKSDNRPGDIPASPAIVYKDKGWVSMGDWLGTGRIAPKDMVFRPFEEARSYVRNLGLNGVDEWNQWRKTNARPIDIPTSPNRVYKDKGWVSYGDWLGVINRWGRNDILNFLYSIEPVLPNLRPVELYAIMREKGMLSSLRDDRKSSKLIKSIRDLCSSSNPESDFEELITEIERENELLDVGELGEQEQDAEIIPTEADDQEELPSLRSLEALKDVDTLVEAGIISDEETIEFLIANRVSGLWQDVLNKELDTELETLRRDSGGYYFNIIRERFYRQYDGAKSLPMPAGYDFRVNGVLTQPNLMQRLTAYRILTERRLGNWSGVGAGKTLSAILASRVVNAHLTIVVAFNSTIVPWKQRIRETFPDSVIYIKERGEIVVDSSKPTYLVLNFELFQQPDSAAMVTALVEQHKIDFIVLDEIQSVKQRTQKITSKRRQVVGGLLTTASEKNPDLCVLGMSATPVINNLFEAKALLELVKGVEFNELSTFSSIANAITMHEKLILYGIRYRPHYSQTIETNIKEVAGNEYLPRLRKLKKGAILDLERVLLEAKIEAILADLQKGTMVYTHYLTGLIDPLRTVIENEGFKVGLFTGEDKSGLDLFIQGKVDILIGSAPVGTGIDGLQYVCNRVIVVSPPWTSAEYEQLIGRLYRQGSRFEKVEVFIPQVVLTHNGDTWSWDKMRMHRIRYKKTLADAALDGVIPEGVLASPETMYKKAREALQAWIERIEQDGIIFIERSRLRLPLPEETTQIIKRRFGDLSLMNARFNAAYSNTTHERLKEYPEEWYLYHTLYREARKTWPEIPYEKIAKSLKKRPDWVIGDFGCGEAKLAKNLPNKVYSFDHVAINENVIACDMAFTPLEDTTLDVAVFSLSLMGLNYVDYLKEAWRLLKFGGMLKIAEPLDRWEEKRVELVSNITEAGFLLVGGIVESNSFLYINAIKTFE